MKTDDTKTKATAPAEEAAEIANIAVDVIKPGTKIGKAICGKGRCSFPLTMSQAKALESLGKVRIVGII